MIDYTALSNPFPPSAVSWRSQSLTKDGTQALALAYIDARDVMRRLDDVRGPAGWQDSYAETGKGRLNCTISKIGRAHARTPVTNAQLVCSLLHEHKKNIVPTTH